MVIKYLNNNGGGFAERIVVDEGTTIRTFVQNHVKDVNRGEFKVRVNGHVVAGEDLLRDGDRVTITPDKIGGAC